jgi:D-alanyl-lipoteichoic acid acyltransferase DltB (MBOAT superfamily)
MLFNTLQFGLFFPLVFVLYWFVFKNSFRSQNILLIIASYYFYACWDWRFLFLLIFSTLLDYSTGILMHDSKFGSKKFWFWLSIFVNLGFLGVFKYYNFFASSFQEMFAAFNVHIDIYTLNIILPVGISFYTFHGLSYVIDIYKGRIEAERNFVDYSLFVSFFPLLVAGPIERATHLLPQMKKERTFEYSKAVDGLRQILWGLFKKVVIADQCAEYANQIFNNYEDHTGSTLFVGAVFFTFQIYGDFSGYSDIALGTARLLGFELLKNFSFPYFSRDIAEFWRRWHISLSSWFRDYLYIPLGGSKGGNWMRIRNTFIIFLVSGFWHGANWTFIFWGFLNALFIIPSVIRNTNRINTNTVAEGNLLPTFKELVQISITFTLTVFAWIFFRSESMTQALEIVSEIFSPSIFTIPIIHPIVISALLVIFLIIEWLGRESKYALEKGLFKNKILRYTFYYAVIFSVVYFGGEKQEFIYFQF